MRKYYSRGSDTLIFTDIAALLNGKSNVEQSRRSLELLPKHTCINKHIYTTWYFKAEVQVCLLKI